MYRNCSQRSTAESILCIHPLHFIHTHSCQQIRPTLCCTSPHIFHKLCMKINLTSPRHDIIVKDSRDEASVKSISPCLFWYSINENGQIDVVFPPAMMKLWSFLCPHLNTWEMRNCTSFATVSCGFWMDALYYKCFPLSWLLFRREGISEIQD